MDTRQNALTSKNGRFWDRLYIMPAVAAWLATPIFVGGTVTWGTVIAVSAAVASTVYSQVQAAQQRKALESLQARSRGFGITSREPAAVRRVIYGTQRVGGTIVYIGASGENNKYLHYVVALTFGEKGVMLPPDPSYLRLVPHLGGQSFQERHGRRMVIAVHEAGHLVFAKLFGHRTLAVSIDREAMKSLGVTGDHAEEMDGVVLHSGEHIARTAEAKNAAELIVSVAGRVVENWLCGTREPRFPAGDALTARASARLLSETDPTSVMDAACSHAFALLGDSLVAEAVTVFADAIHARGTLEEPETDAIWADLLRRHNRPTGLVT